MARIFVPAGRLPVIYDGRLVGLVRPDLTPDPRAPKVNPMSNPSASPYPTFTGSQDDPACPNTYVDADGHVQSRPLFESERAAKAAWVAAAARENADGTFSPAEPASTDADVPAEAPQSPAVAPAAPVRVKAPTAAPDASGVIYVPGKVCRDCSARIERKPGAGRPPAKCLACRAKDAAAAEAKAARKAGK